MRKGDLLANRNTSSNFASSHTWCIKVNDLNHNNIGGEVQYVTIQVSGTTDPKDSDTDGDGILDGEEVDLGVDGWSTNPVLADTDGDDLSDNIEINGTNTPCLTETDPTLKDTDGDGYSDSDDLYMGDAVLRVTLLNYSSLASYGVWPNEQEIVDIFFVITYVQGNIELATKQLIDAHKDQMYYLNWKYDIDIPDNATFVSMIFEAVAEDAAESGIDDGKLDIDNGVGTDTYNVDWNINNTSFFGIGTDSGDRGAYLSVKLQVATAEKANVIIINGTGDGGDYGLDEVSPGVYRYSADEQAYMINLNVSSASTHFVQGMNTIILPRAIALECQLNDTLYDLGSMTSSNVLYNASFYSTNMSSSTSSSHIVVVITKDVADAQAEDILEMLTHNTTGARIGNNVSISSTALYLLHLPGDILSAIPTTVENAGMGEGPSYFSPTGLITDLAGMAFDFLVWVATGGVLLLLAHLVMEGLKAISNLVSTAITAVEAAVDRIVDAFMAFVTWAIEFIEDTIKVIFGPILEPLASMWSNYCLSVCVALVTMLDEYESNNTVSNRSLVQLSRALIGDFFWLCFGVGAAISAVVIALTGVTSVASFLLGIVLSAMVIVIIQSMLSHSVSAEEAGGVPATNTYIPMVSGDQSQALAAAEQMGIAPNHDDNGPSAEKWRACFGVMSFAVGVLGSLFGLAAIPAGPGISYKLAIGGLVSGLIAAALSLADPFQIGSDVATFAGFYFGVFSLVTGGYGIATSRDTFTRNVGFVATGIGAISFVLSIAAVTYDD